jgi:hypothetical protein
MYLKPEESPQDIILQQCHFPTSARKDGAKVCYETVTVVDHEEFSANCGEPLGSLEELLQTAWVILLRSYVKDDLISFAVLLPRQNVHDLKYPAGETSFSAPNEALVVQYQVSEKCLLKDIRPAACWKSSIMALIEAQINTAVQFVNPVFVRNGERRGELPQPTIYHHKGLVNDVCSYSSGVLESVDA